MTLAGANTTGLSPSKICDEVIENKLVTISELIPGFLFSEYQYLKKEHRLSGL